MKIQLVTGVLLLATLAGFGTSILFLVLRPDLYVTGIVLTLITIAFAVCWIFWVLR